MAFDPTRFWSTDYYKNPPLTDSMVADAEERLGVALPEEYVALLRLQNGGYTRGFGHPMTQHTSWSDNHVPLNELNGIGKSGTSLSGHNILDRDYLTKEWGLPPDQVLLAGDGHWWMTLDYRNSPVPSVSWIDVELREDIPIATSFAAFVEGLRPTAEFDC